MKKTNITIDDIAKLLGVSKSTVSRALKNHPDISTKTITAVQELAKSLNYVPNFIASSLRSGKSRLIGLMIPQISYFFFPSVIKAIEMTIHRKGYNLMIMNSDDSYEREVENIEVLISNNVEGILASVARTTTNYDHFQRIKKMGIPMVFFDRVIEDFDADKVLVDDFEGSYRAVKHLIDLGKKRIAIFIGNRNLLISKNRLLGYKKALFEYKIMEDESLILSCESPEASELAMDELIHSGKLPDSIFAISDLTLSGIMKSLVKNKIKIPEQIAVIGFSEEPLSSMYNPSLSRIKPMGFEMGNIAADLLIERIELTEAHLYEPKTVYLGAELIPGASTLGEGKKKG